MVALGCELCWLVTGQDHPTPLPAQRVVREKLGESRACWVACPGADRSGLLPLTVVAMTTERGEGGGEGTPFAPQTMGTYSRSPLALS